MTEIHCPVCDGLNHQSFWFWEKEEKLLRMWAMDTRVHFSICRDCALIFQNPPVHSVPEDETFFSGWDSSSPEMLTYKEPMDWLHQFPGYGKKPGLGLEIYGSETFFQNPLQKEGWEMDAVSVQSLVSEEAVPAVPEGKEYDLIFCRGVLEQVANPQTVLDRLYPHLKSDGGLFADVANPYVMPRKGHLCLTSDDLCVFPFHTLVFSLYKAGFTNRAAEVSGRIRCLGTKIEKNPDAQANQLVPGAVWQQVSSRFQRNYGWAWVVQFLEKYLTQQITQPDLLAKTRQEFLQRPEELALIRDVCGAALLFTEEINTVRQTISQDWSRTMERVFGILTKDYALYDLLKTGEAIPGLGTLPEIERYFLNKKMIYMTNESYFQRFFSQQDADQLCQGLVRSGEVVCKTLSSFL